MSTIYDPKQPLYLDEADVRGEMTRVFATCAGCRRCTSLCGSFPTLFDMIGAHVDRDAGRLTPAQQDEVVDQCFQCKLCAVQCPYSPGDHEWAIDFPRLMLRATAMRARAGKVSGRDRTARHLLGRADLVGRAGTRAAPVANRLIGATEGSLARRVLERLTGVSAVRLLPTFARQRFSTWFANRPKVRIARRQGRVAVFPTCIVEYQQPDIGHDVVKVYERNGIECSLVPRARCCGAPWLHSGDVERFAEVAARNVATLAAAVRKGHDIVVPQPTCGYVITHDYLDHVGGADAELVAAHTYDPAEYLMKVHKGEGTSLDTDFTGFVPGTVTYHTPPSLRAQQIGLRSRDLIKLTGARVKLVERSSGVEGLWGLRGEHAESRLAVAASLGEEIRRAGGDVVAGDCHLSNTVVAEQTGEQPMHPLQLVARAYGIPEEGPAPR